MTYAKVIEDSVNEIGDRLTTMEVRLHRFVLAELNTHRMFSRNSASSRAIPVQKQLERIVNDCAYPVSWPAEQKGMQGGEELDDAMRAQAMEQWEAARDNAVASAEMLRKLGVHKSVTNRLVEPFMWHTVIISATEWNNFWNQRCSSLAQPEIRVAAEMMREAYDESEPEPLKETEWHMPYIDRETISEAWDRYGDAEEAGGGDAEEVLKRISVARCARVSYLTHDGTRDLQADLDLYDRLVSARPGHWSPLEHVATPCPVNATDENHRHFGNFIGWDQLRHDYEDAI